MEKITLKAFRAPNEPELAAGFLREHRRVLEDFGIANVTTNTESWLSDPNACLIVAMHDALGMVGGIRLQIARAAEPLPMEEAIGKLDPKIKTELDALVADGLGEVCSLWNANRFAHKGVTVLLSQAVTAMATMVNVKRMVCLVATYTQRHPKRNGFVVMEQVGDQGTFIYPIPSITAVAMLNPDTMLLPHATSEHRQLLYSIRLRPRQVRYEAPANEHFEVHYDIRINENTLDLFAYQHIEAERLRHTA
jgi:hypothetical protein